MSADKKNDKTVEDVAALAAATRLTQDPGLDPQLRQLAESVANRTADALQQENPDNRG